MSAGRSARRYLRTLRRGVRRRSWLLLGLMIMGVLTEGLGILLLVPLLQLVGLDLGGGTLGRIQEGVAATFRAAGVEPVLPAVLLVFLALVGGRALILYWETTQSARLDQAFTLHLRNRLYRAATYSDWRFFVRRRGSDFLHAMIEELHRVSVATTQVLRLLTQLLVGLVYLAIAVQVSLPVTALAAVSGGGLLWGLSRWNERSRATGVRVSERTHAMAGAIHEHLAAMKTARSYGAEERSVRRFAELADQVASSYVGVVREQAAFSALFAVGSAVILCLIVYVAVAILAVPAAGVLLLLFLFARLVPRFSGVQKSYHQFLNVVPSFDRVMDLIEACEAASDPVASGEGAVLELREAVQLRDVRFAYGANGEGTVLAGLDLVVPAHRTTALVGPSGVGKSTVADLVLGLLRPDAGTISLDGVPLGPETLRAWRRRIGYVPQEPFLFHDTIRANLLWARPDATEEQCWGALRVAAADAFVRALPLGLDTVVGDRGALMSGGERQRLVLARALIREPALLVLDEATSALDARSEQAVLSAIRGLHGRATILVISHRLTTIRDADSIHVLDGGRVVESGTWDELARRPAGVFRELCRVQGLAPEGHSAEP